MFALIFFSLATFKISFMQRRSKNENPFWSQTSNAPNKPIHRAICSGYRNTKKNRYCTNHSTTYNTINPHATFIAVAHILHRYTVPSRYILTIKPLSICARIKNLPPTPTQEKCKFKSLCSRRYSIIAILGVQRDAHHQTNIYIYSIYITVIAGVHRESERCKYYGNFGLTITHTHRAGGSANIYNPIAAVIYI